MGCAVDTLSGVSAEAFGFWFGVPTENDVVICLPAGLITYHGPPSWSMACPVTMPAVTSRLYV